MDHRVTDYRESRLQCTGHSGVQPRIFRGQQAELHSPRVPRWASMAHWQFTHQCHHAPPHIDKTTTYRTDFLPKIRSAPIKTHPTTTTLAIASTLICLLRNRLPGDSTTAIRRPVIPRHPDRCPPARPNVKVTNRHQTAPRLPLDPRLPLVSQA